MSIINLEWRITTYFSCFLPSSSREQRSNTGILGIAAHRMLVSHPLCRLLVSFAGTKHCCLTAINRDGALCCPDFPRSRGLKQLFFFPYSAIDRCTVSKFALLYSLPKLCFLFPVTYREFRELEVGGAIAVALNRQAIFLRQAHIPLLSTGVPENF